MVYETVLPTLLISTEQNGCFVISQRGIVKSPLNQPVKPYVSTSTAIICVAIGSNSPNIIISRKFTIAMKNGPFIDGLPKVTYKNMVIFFAVTVFPSFLWTTCLGSFSNPAETIETLKNRKKKSIGIPWVNGFFDRVSLEFPWTPYRNPIKKTIDPLRIPKKKKKTLKTHEKKLRSFLLRIPPQRHCPIRRATRQRSVAAGHAEDVAVAVQLTGAEILQGHHGWAHMCILLLIWYM